MELNELKEKILMIEVDLMSAWNNDETQWNDDQAKAFKEVVIDTLELECNYIYELINSII